MTVMNYDCYKFAGQKVYSIYKTNQKLVNKQLKYQIPNENNFFFL